MCAKIVTMLIVSIFCNFVYKLLVVLGNFAKIFLPHSNAFFMAQEFDLSSALVLTSLNMNSK